MSRNTDMTESERTATFEKARPALLGLAYRMLGSLADAEDAVQDTFIKWSSADQAKIDNQRAWLTTTCTHRCLDILRAAHRTRVNYVGAWLPEPIHTPVDRDIDGELDLADSLSTAFLLLLERLSPKERAAFLLHEVLDQSYTEVAATLDMQEPACRKLVSRAKSNISHGQVRYSALPEHQERLLEAFRTAVTTGAIAPLESLLASDIQLRADGGGKVPAALNIIRGATDVLAFVAKGLRKYWRDYELAPAYLNGTHGFTVTHQETIVAAVSFAYDATGKATDIYIMRNPDKLGKTTEVAIE